jgi:uncharacterized protein DUF4192
MNRIERPLRLRDPGELVAAIPHILGFHPDNSLILVTVRGPTHVLGPCIRVDVESPSDDQAFADYLLCLLGQ